MRQKISTKSIQFYARQSFGLNKTQLEEVLKGDSETKHNLIKGVLRQFNGLVPVESDQETYANFTFANPYGKEKQISLESAFEVTNTKDLVMEASNLHKVQMVMLDESRKKVLTLESDSKERSSTETRQQELKQETPEETLEQEEELEY